MNKRDDHDKDVETPQSTDVEQGRREFLKGGVAAAGAGLAAGVVPGLAVAAAAESDAKAATKGTTVLQDVIARPERRTPGVFQTLKGDNPSVAL